MSKSTELSVTTVLAVFLLSGLCFGGVITVDAGAVGNNDGSSWVDAYSQLQSALAAASSGDEIRVAQGLYKPAEVSGNRAATFQLLNGVTIKGGYAGSGAPEPDIRDVDVYETILSGDLNGDDSPDFANNGENSYHVVTGSSTDETAVLDGLTVTGGNANVLDFDARGGGMHNSFGSPTISDCVFSRNFALTMGGGMFNYESCPTITGCVFIENRSDDDGGGIRNYINSHAIITNCDFSGNSAFEDGGGLNNRKNSNAIVTGCAFIGNTSASGGGMENHVGKAITTGVPIISNCTFIGNTANAGGGMRNNDVSAIVTNCTFVGNIGSGMNNRKNNPTITSCIFWANTGGSFDGSGSPVVTFSDVEGGFSGTENINADPLFTDPANDNYHLQLNSPCINTGDPNYTPCPQERDIDGQNRVMGNRIDMGADEVGDILGDINNSGTVNIGDFAHISRSWSTTVDQEGWDESCDINGDGRIDILDYFWLAENWGKESDSEPPTVPGNPVLNSVTIATVSLGWDASVDCVDVVGYKVYRDGEYVGFAQDTNYTDNQLESATVYTYKVSAYDASYNESGLSEPCQATTN
jgi:hypothetical protein